jgi:hypothetical protein
MGFKQKRGFPLRPFNVLILLFLTAAGFGQKLDSWVVDNARIGPDSPIELTPGSTYNPRVEYPNPDGPMSPLKAKIAWSIKPAVEGIAIDPLTGKIAIANTVPAGTTAIVHASINDGLRKISSKIIIFSLAENPLQGEWIVKSVIACDPAQKATPPNTSPQPSDHFKFYVDHKIFIGRPFGIAATTRLLGDYQVDVNAHSLKIAPSWPKGRAAQEWLFEISDDRELKLNLPDAVRDEKTQVCGYLLSRSQTVSPKALAR